MYEVSKLRGKIAEKYGSQAAFAEAIHRSNGYVSKYMNGKAVLDQDSIKKWADALDIKGDEIGVYFFTIKLHEMEDGQNEQRSF